MALEAPATLPSPEKIKSNLPWRLIAKIALGLVIVVIIFLAGLFFWYTQNLTPKDPRSTIKIHFSVQKGDTTDIIAQHLEQQGIIKSSLAFAWYMRLQQPAAVLQAGRYALSPKLSIEDIAKHLKSGKTDLFMITILPGSTLADIKKNLQKYGYSSQEIDAAFAATYTHPLLADRPPGQGLEGYIFPETFEMQSTASLESLFIRDFDTLYGRLQADGLIDQFKAHGLNLHQALTMASMVQKETGTVKDQPMVAQVFYKRLSSDMKLESDTTFIYAAKKLGIEPSISLDSPYNTRLYKGLPPGPISNMNYSALQAVAQPASTDFLYFVAGDNGTSYFAHTIEEHESNVQKYCHKLCN